MIPVCIEEPNFNTLFVQQEIVPLEQLLVEWLLVLLYCLLPLQLGLHGGVDGNHKNISLTYLVGGLIKKDVIIYIYDRDVL